MILETVRVVNPSSDTGMLINAIDFDPSIHALYNPAPKKKVEISAEEDVVEVPKKGRPVSKNDKK